VGIEVWSSKLLLGFVLEMQASLSVKQINFNTYTFIMSPFKHGKIIKKEAEADLVHPKKQV
jgi:hypothetical protein